MAPYELNFSGVSDNTLFQAYCLNPPSDSCTYGPCPNPDVTGVGQQVSLYITATIFSISFFYFPQDIKTTSTTYLANIYALLISALISMFQGELTRNDAVFVLVATLSPATLYLWAMVVISVFNRGVLPDYFKETMSRFGQRIMLLFSFVSFILWSVVVALVLWPPNPNYFSQPACQKYYGKEMLITLLWSAKFSFGFFVAVAAVFLIAWHRRKHMDRRRSTSDLIPEQGLIRFTRTSLTAFKPLTATPLLLFMQGSVIQTTGPLKIYFVNIAIDCLAVVLCLVSAIQSSQGWRGWQHLSRSQRFTPFAMLVIFGLACLSSTHSTYFYFTFCNCMTYIFSFFIWWRYIGDLYANKSYVLRAIWRFCLVVPIFISLILKIPFVGRLGRWLVPQLWWFCAWETSFFIPSSSRWGDLKRLWVDIIEETPVFKFSYLVLGPTIMWIQSTVFTNPTKSDTMTFGQIFALLVAMISLTSLVKNVFHHRKAIGRAVWLTDNCAGDGDADIPLHIRPTSDSNSNAPGPNPMTDTSPTAFPIPDGSSLSLPPTNTDDPITFTSEIAPNAPDDSVATSTLRETNLNVTRRHTTLP